MIKIDYENKENIEDIYRLWQDTFKDSEGFAEYYFKEKCKENRILTLGEDGKVLSMLHLNPYNISLSENLMEAFYIVGVATDKNYRRKGYMRIVLEKALRDMAAEGRPFTFLMPESTSYYTPFNFSRLYETVAIEYDSWDNNEKDNKDKEIKLINIQDIHSSEYIQSIGRVMEGFYNMYAIRDAGYFSSLLKESKGEGGDVVFFKKDSKLIGYFSYYISGGKARINQLISDFSVEEAIELVREYLYSYSTNFILPKYLVHKEGMDLEKALSKKEDKGIMFRSLRPDKLLTLLRSQEKRELMIKIVDPIILENNKVYLWKIGPKYSELIECKEENQIVLTIEDVNNLVFGEGSLEGMKVYWKNGHNKRILINEVV